MPETWATSGLDLHLDVAGTQPRAALEQALRAAVTSGRLAAGTPLPSSRALARDLGVARNTVAEAYAQLTAEGWLIARTGSGTRVADRVEPEPVDARRSPGARRPAYDLTPGRPDLASFPRSAWIAATRRALSAASTSTFDYGDPRGLPELRRVLAGYLARARGVRASPERMVVTSGVGQGLALLAEATRDAGGETVGVEAYGLRAHRQLLAGLALASVPVDEAGADLTTLTAQLAVLTPAHHFPLGVALAPRRRTAAVQWSVEHDAVVLEDDYDGEFRYDRQPVGALQALAPDRVVHAGSVAKTLAPGVRLGWLVLPERLVEPVAELKRTTARHTGVLEQVTLAEFLSSGGYDRHVRRQRLAYRYRRDQLAEALGRVPGVTLGGLAAGLHALVRLPPGLGEAEATERAAALGLAVEGLDEYAVEPGGRPPALVVGYATPPGHAYAGAVSRLVAALAG